MGNREKELKIKIIGAGTNGSSLVNELATSLSENTNISYLTIDSDSYSKNSVKQLEGVKNILLDKEDLSDKNGTSTISIFNIRKDIKDSLNEIDLVILISGLGGTTGTNVAPIVSSIVKEEHKILISINIFPFLYEGNKKILLAKKAFMKLENKSSAIIKIDNEVLAKEFPELTINELKKYSNNKIKNDINTILYFINNYKNGLIDLSDILDILKFGNEMFLKNVFAIGDERINKILSNLFKKNNTNIEFSTIKKAVLIIETSNDFFPRDFEKIDEYIRQKTNQEIDIKIFHIINKQLRKEMKFFLISSFSNSQVFITTEKMLAPDAEKTNTKTNILPNELQTKDELLITKSETIIKDHSFDNDDDDVPFFMK